jgi:hypothetical protein
MGRTCMNVAGSNAHSPDWRSAAAEWKVPLPVRSVGQFRPVGQSPALLPRTAPDDSSGGGFSGAGGGASKDIDCRSDVSNNDAKRDVISSFRAASTSPLLMALRRACRNWSSWISRGLQLEPNGGWVTQIHTMQREEGACRSYSFEGF